VIPAFASKYIVLFIIILPEKTIVHGPA